MVILFRGRVRQLWKKCQKLETSRTALREAVKLLQAENEKLQKDNSELSKGTYLATTRPTAFPDFSSQCVLSLFSFFCITNYDPGYK